MHLPAHNKESRIPVLHQFIRENPLGVITTAIRSLSFPLLQASHIPWVLDDIGHASSAIADLGRLRGHMARQNPQAQAIMEHVAAAGAESDSIVLEEEVLVMFNGPMHHYITPKFYKQTKPDTGKVVPTWNYDAVQVYGKARVYIDTKSDAFGAYLSKQMDDLTHDSEANIMGYGTANNQETLAWKVSDAPDRYVDLLKKNLIGIEIEITSMNGRFKMSQEKPLGDRSGVIEGIRGLKSPIGEPLSELITKRAEDYDKSRSSKQ